MEDITFIFPVRIDSQERLENTETNIKYLRSLFPYCEILVAQDGTRNEFQGMVNHIYTSFGESFYKTKIINNAVRLCNTTYIAIIDVDLFFAREDYEEAFSKIESGEYDFVFGYSGECWNYKRSFCSVILKNGITQLKHYDNHRLELMNKNAVGGSVWCSVENFFKIGGQNENIISWGFEDNEFYNKILKLEKRFYRTPGMTYHIMHPRGENSSSSNPKIDDNSLEYNRICKLTKEELEDEIKTWPWVKLALQ